VCAFVGLVNKLYKMHGTYIKITIHFFIRVVDRVLGLVLGICSLLLQNLYFAQEVSFPVIVNQK